MNVITDTNGTVEELPLRVLKETDRLGEPWDGTLRTFREEVEGSSVETGTTEVFVMKNGDLKFAGRLNDIEYDGTDANLIIDSWEQDGNDAPLTKGANSTGNKFEEVYETDSETIFTDAINNVGSLSVGSVDIAASGNTNSLVFSNTPQDKKIRQLELGDEFFAIYNYDKTVDYTSTPGADRTGTTLSPDSGLISDKMQVVRDGFDDGYTDILLLGAGAGGDDQISTTIELVANPDRRKEKRIDLKNVYSKARLDQIASQLEIVLQEDLVDVRTVIRDTEVNIGDKFHVEKSEENLNRDLYVVEYERTFSGVERYEVVLSSRRRFRDDVVEEVFKNIESYKTSKEPPVVFLNGGGGNRSTVGPGNPWEMSQFFPEDVVHERETTLQIRGRAYRAFSSGAADGGSVTTSSGATAPEGQFVDTRQFRQRYTIPIESQGWVDLRSLNTSIDDDYVFGHVSVENSTNTVLHNLWLRVVVDGNEVSRVNFLNNPIPPGIESFASGSIFCDVRDTDTSNSDVTIQLAYVDLPDNNSRNERVATYLHTSNTHTHEISIDPHTHQPKPGVQDFNNLYPKNINVEINRKMIATDFAGNGNNPFEAEVDVTGELDPGFNDIKIHSDSLGHIEAAVGGRLALQNTFQ